MQQFLGVAPSNANDIVTKSYVDAATAANDAADNIPGPPVGWYIGSQYVQSTGTSAHATGVWCFLPVNIPYTATYDAFVANLATARSGGTGTVSLAALYPDNGAGFPDTTTPRASGTMVDTVTGKVTTTFASAQTLTKGLYWTGFLYYQGTAAPTTAPAWSSVASFSMMTPLSPTIAVGSAMRGLRSSTATFTTYPGALSPSNMITQTAGNTAYIMLRRSA